MYGIQHDWQSILETLINHYSEKRNSQTLLPELFNVKQNASLESFYNDVIKILIQLINSVQFDVSEVSVREDRIANYRANALHVFLSGIREPIGGVVRSRKPTTLREAYDACIQEIGCRKRTNNTSTRSINYSLPNTRPFFNMANANTNTSTRSQDVSNRAGAYSQ